MIRNLESITLFSQNPQKLAQFYQKKVGLKATLEAELGEKGMDLYGFEMKGGSGLYITYHSQVKGKNKMPERIIINFEVDNIEVEVKRLVKAGVQLIQEIYHIEGYGQIAIFADIDGNYFQLAQIRPSK